MGNRVMSEDFLVDVFPAPLDNEQAQFYFGNFITINDDGEPDNQASLRLFLFEEKYIKFFLLLFGGRLDELSITLKDSVAKELESKPWAKERFSNKEVTMLKDLGDKFRETRIHNISESDLVLFVKISCRELFFPEFSFSGVSIKACDENVFLVAGDDCEQISTIKDVAKGIELYIR